ncbi:hypothetical protein AB0I52_10050 [Streptomyces sp. NPDC050423]|uniref:hypothetical protein n=1 Tax=Streptomyces sp. NPDC050423 TaxID=3155402 RepID=UPI0034497DC7
MDERTRWVKAAWLTSGVCGLIVFAGLSVGVVSGEGMVLGLEVQRWVLRALLVLTALGVAGACLAQVSPKRRAAVLGPVFLALLFLAAIWSSRTLLSDWQTQRLGPGDAPTAVVAIVSIGTMIGVLTKSILSGLAQFTQSRGTADAEKVRAQAELLRAQADMLRAQHALPPPDGDPGGTAPGRTPPGTTPAPDETN